MASTYNGKRKIYGKGKRGERERERERERGGLMSEILYITTQHAFV
jgi:hypothetical protein